VCEQQREKHKQASHFLGGRMDALYSHVTCAPEALSCVLYNMGTFPRSLILQTCVPRRSFLRLGKAHPPLSFQPSQCARNSHPP
jgi:hypothetical protein